MAQQNVLLTYGDQMIETDIVRDSVEIISAREDGIYSKLGKTKAIAMIHSYGVDTLATAGSLAVEQGQDFTYSARTTPTLLTNLVQEVANPIRVTRPQTAVQHYTGENELDRQLAKGMMEFTNSVEYDLVRATLASGVSGTVQKMNGIIAAISKSTNYTSQTSGTVFSATVLDGLMEQNWQNSNGDVATDLYVGGIMKRVTDQFIQKTNVVVNSPDIKGIVKTVTTYETAFGTLTIHKHRYIQQNGDATGRILAIRPEKLKVAFLEAPTILNNLTVGGAYLPRAVYASLTLEVRNQDSNFYCDGFLLAA
ncbi:MAG: SU10 major capsid protein [Minisyncoccota bacterium]